MSKGALSMEVQDILATHIYKVIEVVPLLFLLLASWTDIRTRKIKNYTTYPMFVLGLGAAAYSGGASGLIYALGAGAALGFAVYFVPGFVVGTGDIKLAAACGSWIVNFYPALFFLLFTIVLVTFCNIAVLLRARGFRSVIEQIRYELISLFYLKSMPRQTKEGVIKSAPLSPFMAVSYVLVTVLY